MKADFDEPADVGDRRPPTDGSLPLIVFVVLVVVGAALLVLLRS